MLWQPGLADWHEKAEQDRRWVMKPISYIATRHADAALVRLALNRLPSLDRDRVERMLEALRIQWWRIG